ncbi:hypothetical protein B0T14DRAFT_329802 [Immersiella caudata]|uniref:Uncharacterized protein n=1 Tax=Immersiella caudata TaxID=314043 RepID=A0AA39U5P3_9PEZI|nr:hypothetical protein B0T14DRAFT_329802 [Immersiella caudata]
MEGNYSESVPRPGEVEFISAGSPCPGFSLLTQDKTHLETSQKPIMSCVVRSFCGPSPSQVRNLGERARHCTRQEELGRERPLATLLHTRGDGLPNSGDPWRRLVAWGSANTHARVLVLRSARHPAARCASLIPLTSPRKQGSSDWELVQRRALRPAALWANSIQACDSCRSHGGPTSCARCQA